MSDVPRVIVSESAPRPIGPYSQAVESDGLLFVSGQIGMDAATGILVPGGAARQAEAALQHISSILSAAGIGLEQVLRVTVYLKDMADFPAVNEVYAQFFSSWKPARTTIGVSQLPKDALVEIDVVVRTR